MRAFAKAHQRLGEMLVGVHGNVAGDVVENIGLGQVIQLVGTADGDGGGEGAVAEAIEEDKRRDVAADGLGLKSGQWLQETIDIFQARDAIRIQAQRMDALQEMLVGVTIPAWKHARVQLAPSLVILVGVQLVRLLDVELPGRAWPAR